MTKKGKIFFNRKEIEKNTTKVDVSQEGSESSIQLKRLMKQILQKHNQNKIEEGTPEKTEENKEKKRAKSNK